MATDLDEAPKTAAASGSATFTFGAQQGVVMMDVEAWYRGWTLGEHKRQIFRLFGFAGTGKTTLARHLAGNVSGKVYFAAYTGKAALMMRQNGCRKASTIHSLLYRISIDDSGRMSFVLDRMSPLARAALIVIDECSMVDGKVGADLLSFGVPILVLGDPAQLPPVKGSGFFTAAAKPDGMLTEIHRQARDNAIIRFATDVRQGRPLPYGDFGEVVIGRRGERDAAAVLEADQLIVGRNTTRQAYNRKLRSHLGRKTALPEKGDRLVCLRNDASVGVLNGGLFEVQRASRSARSPDLITMLLRNEDFLEQNDIVVRCRPEFFEGGAEDLRWKDLIDTQQFDYGYALTGHKSQGSQWRHVIAYDESRSFGRDAQRWLYTVITRASERLTLVR